ncbi:hypothetical protein VTJ83DRAFT_4871 [Remersonia thermophila]|uniref:Uncharacterized protein n=1 Tax=Remersonia thermophila TaxID=72144 RepID=A0ABR4DB62_9PEZI
MSSRLPDGKLTAPGQEAWGQQPRPQQLDASHCHPVFFTNKLRRPPFGALSGQQSSPVAHGYVYRDGPGLRTGGRL